MRKQGLFILLLLMSFCSMMRAQTSFTYGGLNYTVLSEADGTAIVGKQDASLSGGVIIRATAYDSSTELYYTVVAVGDSAFLDTKITSVTFPSGVIKSIGARAFKNCKELSSFTIPSSVTTIGEAAMAHCDALTSITIPDGLTSIGFTAFSSCESLSQIVVEAGNTVYDSRNGCNALIETATNTLLTGCKNTYIYNSITSIADNAFKDCVGLTAINIPESVESIGERAFQGCENLQSINIPSSITSISNNTFNGCKALTSFILPEKLNSIGDYALNGCAGLTSLVIPAGVSSIGQNALANCTGLKWVVVKDGVSDIAVGADTFSGMPATTILYVPAGKRSEFANNSVWKIFKSIIQDDNITFADSNVKSVCVDNWDTNEDGELSQVEALMVTSLGQKFRGNTDIISFKELQYFRSLNTLNDDFRDCSNLVDIKFPNSIKNIGESTFSGCRKLTLADGLPEYLENIGVYAFTYCYNLGDIYIPETVTNIDFRAFRESNPLSLTVDPDNTIYDSRNNCNAIILKSEDGLWVGCSKTVIPEGVKYLNWYSFSGRKGLEYIVIPEGMEHVGNRTFLRTDLHSVTLPSTIKTIGENAFERCGYLKEIVINTSDTVAIEKDAFPEGVDGMKIYAKKGFKANNLKPLTVGLGSWATQVMYDYIKVTELVSGRDKVIAEEHFNTDAMDNWEVHGGTWEISNGSLCQTSDSNDCMITLKNIELPAKYKYNIRAKRTGGYEGFLAVVNFENESNWQWWNIGGWQNTKHCLEYAPSGLNNYIGDPVEGGIIVGDWNDIEIIVDNQYITCILNGDTVHKNVVNTKHNYWKNYTIYEHDESNVVSAKEAVGRNGGKIIVPVELKNEKEVYQFQCDIIVPDGMELSDVKKNSLRASSHTASMRKVEDNHYRLVIIDADGKPFSGNGGELFKMTLSVSDEISEGDYRLRLNDIVVTDKDENRITIPYFISNLRVDNSANVGDVNGDGYIDVVDIMGIVNHILGGSHSSFEANAADVNGDGYIDVVDIMGLVNKILGNDSSSAKFFRYQMREAE